MDDWSDAIAQGILCKRCVLPMEDDLAPGPRLCHWCREEDRIASDDDRRDDGIPGDLPSLR